MDARGSVNALVQVANSSPPRCLHSSLATAVSKWTCWTFARDTLEKRMPINQSRHHERITQKVTHALAARLRMC